MANQIVNIRAKMKTDTEANWTKNNPVLLAGEMAISSDKDNKYKVGDGTSKWSALKYAKANLEKSDVTTALGYTPPSKDTTTAGSATQPVYFSNGKPVATTYKLGKSVPNNAVFTDTNTKVTSVENHYKPSPYNSETLSAPYGALKDITNSSSGVPVVTGITKDEAGHVTGFTSITLKSTNTTYELMSVTEFESLFK